MTCSLLLNYPVLFDGLLLFYVFYVFMFYFIVGIFQLLKRSSSDEMLRYLILFRCFILLCFWCSIILYYLILFHSVDFFSIMLECLIVDMFNFVELFSSAEVFNSVEMLNFLIVFKSIENFNSVWSVQFCWSVYCCWGVQCCWLFSSVEIFSTVEMFILLASSIPMECFILLKF